MGMKEMTPGKTLKDPVCTLSQGQAPAQSVDMDEFDAQVSAKAAKAALIPDDLDEDFLGSDEYDPEELGDGYDEMEL